MFCYTNHSLTMVFVVKQKKIWKKTWKNKQNYSDFFFLFNSRNDSWSTLRSPDLNQKIHEPDPKFHSKSNDSQTGSEVPLWIKRFTNPLRSSDLNQKIHKPSFHIGTLERRSWIVQFVKWYANPLQSSDLNQKIHKLRIHAPKLRSKLNDLRYVIRLEHFETVNHFATQLIEFWRALLHPSLYVIFKIITSDVEIRKLNALCFVFCFLLVNRLNWMKSRVCVPVAQW